MIIIVATFNSCERALVRGAMQYPILKLNPKTHFLPWLHKKILASLTALGWNFEFYYVWQVKHSLINDFFKFHVVFFVKVNFNFQWTILAFSLKLLATGCCCLCPCQSGNDRLISIQRQIISGISNLKFMSQILRMISLKFLRTNLVFFCENYKNRCNNKRGQFDFYEYNVGVKIDFVQVKLFYLDKKVLCFE